MMSRSIRFTSLRCRVGAAVLILAAALVPATALPVLGDAELPVGHQGHTAAKVRYTRSFAFYTIPSVELIDMDGERVDLASILAEPRPLMLQFIFTTCPGVCPMMSAIFSAAQRELGADLDEVRWVSISIDPEHDTPERLRAYAERFDAAPRWLFLTGPLEEVVRLQKAFGAFRGNKMRHEPATYVRLAPDDPWLRLYGFPSARELVAEVRSLAGL